MLMYCLLIFLVAALAILLAELYFLRRYLSGSSQIFCITPIVSQIYNLCTLNERLMKDPSHRVRFKSGSKIHPKVFEYYVEHVLRVTKAQCAMLLSKERCTVSPRQYLDDFDKARDAFTPWIHSGATALRKREVTAESVSFEHLNHRGIKILLIEHIILSSGERCVLVCGFEYIDSLTPEMQHDVTLMAKQCDEDLEVLSHVFELTDKLHELSSVASERDTHLQYITHDIRSPLHNLSLVLNSLQDEVSDKDMIAAGIRSLSSAQKVVDELLVDRTQKLENVCELSALFEELHREYLHTAQQKNITFDVSPLIGPIKVMFNPHDLKRTLHNFISNGIKYTLSGFVRLTYTQLSESEGKIQITDSGIGMSEEELASFGFSEGRFRKELGSGFGIGAVGAFRLIQQNGSKITVSSEMGKGTHISISLSCC